MTWIPPRVPPPGSPDAIHRGCTCPTDDNRHGRGAHGTAGPSARYITVDTCPLHAGRTYPESTD